MSNIISKKDVNYIAVLAKLEFQENEVEQLTTEMNNMLNYVRKLDELDTTGVETTFHALSINNAMREDIIKPSLTAEEALLNAPKSVKSHFEVPRVIES